MNAYKLLVWQAGILACLCLAHVSAPASQAAEVDFSALDRLVTHGPLVAASSPDFSALDRLVEPVAACPAPSFAALDKLLEVAPPPAPKPAPVIVPKPGVPAAPPVPPARLPQPALHPMPVPTCRNGQCLDPSSLMGLSAKQLRKLRSNSN